MSQYVNSRDTIGNSIAKLCSAAKSISDDITLAELKTKLSLLNDRWTKYENYHHEVLNVTGTQELDVQQGIGFEIEAAYERTLTLLITHMDRIQATQAAAGSRESSTTSNHIPNNTPATDFESSHVHLPAIRLPNFQGTYGEWGQFKDLFTSLILNNTKISNVQKLHYLKSSIGGEAAKLLESYSIADCNFELAWNSLVTRFENKRSITTTYLQQIVDAPHVKSESSYELRKLLDETDASLKQLQNLEYPTEEWDALITFLVVRKLDSETRRQWELHLTSNDYPTWTDLTTFVYNRCRSLELLDSESRTIRAKPTTIHSNRNNKRGVTSFVANARTQNESCPICQLQPTHRLQKCPTFNSWTLEQRTKFIQESRRCFNCMKLGHSKNVCRSFWRCTICRKSHHTLLHSNSTTSSPTTITSEHNTEELPTVSSHSTSFNSPQLTTVLLATATIKIQTKFGTLEKIRALIDQGSQCSFITESAAQRFGLQGHKTNVTVSGIGQLPTEISRNRVCFQFTSINNETQKYNCSALVIRKITCNQPSTTIDKTIFAELQGMDLADPTFNIRNRIDVLLGADMYGILLKEGLRLTRIKGLIAQNTQLGWIISGPTSQEISTANNLHSFHVNVDSENINTTLRKFWELEEVSSKKILSEEEQMCEQHFSSTHTRNSDGRYIVKLPFKQPIPTLGSSKYNAITRLNQVEQRLANHPEIQKEYDQFMKQYIELGHMRMLSPLETISPNSYYIPHHHIIKSDSSTTKLRVVFDASRPTTTGVSLNECMMVGPTIQEDIVSLLLRWRTHKIAFVADIEKMYRQILVSDNDTDFQRIVYRSSPQQPIQTYKLLTVTYGTSSAPFLAVRCLKQLALDESQRFPEASFTVSSDFYVDDLMSGADNISTALTLQRQLINLLECGGFTLRKWASNESELLNSVPNEHRESYHHNIPTDESIKALGLSWYPTTDEFFFKIRFQHNTLHPTKRTMLSDASKFFDPIGWLAPIIIKMKIQLQHLWITGLGWDDKLPGLLRDEWLTLQGNLKQIELIRIPRWTGFNSITPFELHGFCDASNKAYAAVVFSRTIVDNSVITKFIIAKTRVAPIKTVSIPRLELCAAVLLTKLLKLVTGALTNKPTNVIGWTDSTIVLSWLKSHPSKWKCFIANRTSEILQTMNCDQWRHVPTHENPADCASRGLLPAELLSHELWWSGPSWLRQDPEFWPTHTITTNNSIEEIRSTVNAFSTIIEDNWDLIDRYSSIEKLQRVTAYTIRFSHIARKQDHRTGYITAREMQAGLTALIKNVQKGMYPIEYTNLTKNKSVTGKLACLNPFLDESKILRVGGRLEKSTLDNQQIHPIILSPNHTLTRLLVEQGHRVTLHGGPQLVLYHLLKRYWIINGKKVIRKIVNNCMVCFRHRVKGRQQLMGQLPSVRVTPSRPFLSSGVDYAGPITIKVNHLRGARCSKAYIAVFVCMAVKAVHLEAVSSLTSEGFIAAYKRFVSRRGLCKNLYSDNGTNFVGANVILKANHQRATRTLSPDIAKLLANDGTEWHFIPPYSPHFGGLWEAAVKSVKTHLVRTMKDSRLTFEELTTVLTQIEACLNSRPLCPVSADSNDVEALSPSHFLVGGNLLSVPEPSVIAIKYPRRWVLVQSLYQQFWRQWSADYLHRLQQRPKWVRQQENIYPGQLVIIIHDNMPPAKWLLGRILDTKAGDDGLVRVATVKCAIGDVKRPITKLCPLPFLADNNNEEE